MRYKQILSTLWLASSLIVFHSCQESFDSRLQKNAQDYTKRYCPKQIDDFVVLDSVVYHMPENDKAGEYCYYHTMHCTAEEVEQLKSQEQTAHDDILEKINNTQDLKSLKENGKTIGYIFYYDGKLVLDFKYKKGEYR